MRKPDKKKFAKNDQPQQIESEFPPPSRVKNTEPLHARTEAQKRYINAIKSFPLAFGLGPAGTGKTYIAGVLAAQLLTNKTVERIIVTRPAVESGESLGFLPGELEEKYEPFIAPFREVLEERLGSSAVEYLLKSGRIEAAPLAYMRGRTFKNSFVILDEAQNTTPRQMKLFLSRLGEGSKCVVDGDPMQSDINCYDNHNHPTNGLIDAVHRLRHIPSVKIVEFTRKDIVRSGLVQEIVQAYEVAIPEIGIEGV
jgi:phosphate starvation-inducible PhoH-like protein